MPHRDESLSAQQTLWIDVRVDIGDIGDIIPVLLQPKGQWEFPRQEFAGATGGLVLVNGMGKQAVGAIEAHCPAGYTGAGIPFMCCVNREIGWPAVVG